MEELLNKELTYGQLTRGVLKEEPKKGNSKEKQLKEIEAICRLKTEEIMTGKKKSYIYIIEEIYQEPKEITDNRKNNKGRPAKCLDYTRFKVSKEDWYKSGIYKIQLENKVYIGSTKNFRNRYIKHLKHDEEELPYVWELLKEESHVFEVLEVVKDVKELNTREQYYIDLYLTNGYEVVNKYRAFGKKQDIRERTKKIKVNERDYEKVIELCRNNGIEIL